MRDLHLQIQQYYEVFPLSLHHPETFPHATIVGLNGVVVDLRVTPYAKLKHIDIWHAMEVRGIDYRVVMEVAAWEGETLCR